MEKKITGYTTVDISQWHRKEHFEAFQSVAQCTYNQTVQLDITAFLKTVKKNKHKFYPAFIHILARLMNAHPEFALTYINCVALTARFPVGKPVVPAALMNRPTRGERPAPIALPNSCAA